MSKPIEKLQEGNVQAAIWQNDSVKGSFKSASFQLRYKGDDGQWKDGKSFGLKDVENLIKVATEARERLLKKPTAPTNEAA